MALGNTFLSIGEDFYYGQKNPQTNQIIIRILPNLMHLLENTSN